MRFEQKRRGSGYFKLCLSACLPKRNLSKKKKKPQKVLKFPYDRQSFVIMSFENLLFSPLFCTLHLKFIIYIMGEHRLKCGLFFFPVRFALGNKLMNKLSSKLFDSSESRRDCYIAFMIH